MARYAAISAGGPNTPNVSRDTSGWAGPVDGFGSVVEPPSVQPTAASARPTATTTPSNARRPRLALTGILLAPTGWCPSRVAPGADNPSDLADRWPESHVATPIGGVTSLR